MINRIVTTMAEALEGITDGATILVGGFGNVGQPRALLEGLIERGVKDLTIASDRKSVV